MKGEMPWPIVNQQRIVVADLRDQPLKPRIAAAAKAEMMSQSTWIRRALDKQLREVGVKLEPAE